MSDTSTKYAGLGLNVAYGSGASWSNADRITALDASRAAMQIPAFGAHSDYLRGYSFGYAVPSTATIDGVAVKVWVYDVGGIATTKYISTMYLLGSSGTPIGNNAASSTAIASPAPNTFGGASDKWGATLTPAVVNSGAFGARFQIYADDLHNFECDAMQIIVYYTDSDGATGKTSWFM